MYGFTCRARCSMRSTALSAENLQASGDPQDRSNLLELRHRAAHGRASPSRARGMAPGVPDPFPGERGAPRSPRGARSATLGGADHAPRLHPHRPRSLPTAAVPTSATTSIGPSWGSTTCSRTASVAAFPRLRSVFRGHVRAGRDIGGYGGSSVQRWGVTADAPIAMFDLMSCFDESASARSSGLLRRGAVDVAEQVHAAEGVAPRPIPDGTRTERSSVARSAASTCGSRSRHCGGDKRPPRSGHRHPRFDDLAATGHRWRLLRHVCRSSRRRAVAGDGKHRPPRLQARRCPLFDELLAPPHRRRIRA